MRLPPWPEPGGGEAERRVCLVSRSNLEEFILLGLTVWPVLLGLMATLRVLTGATKSSTFDASEEDEERPTLGSYASSLHLGVEKSTDEMKSTVNKVENQIVDLQRAHDTRFADLHKDLAGIVWELSKLRADMARWQALQQLGARGSAKAASSGALLPKPGVSSPAAEGSAAAPRGASGVNATGAAEAAGGARVWRGAEP